MQICFCKHFFAHFGFSATIHTPLTIYPAIVDQPSTYTLEFTMDNDLAISSLDSYQKNLKNYGFGSITTEVKSNQKFNYAEKYHQQYLAKPGSRPYCSAMPTQVPLGDFEGSNFKLPKDVWSHFDWGISHCVLRSNIEPIQQ